MERLGRDGEKRETEVCRPNDKNRGDETDPRSVGTSANPRGKLGHVKIPIDRAFRERTDRFRPLISSTDKVLGGILRQLIAQTRNQAARLETELQELQTQINEWEELLESLEKAATGSTTGSKN